MHCGKMLEGSLIISTTSARVQPALYIPPRTPPQRRNLQRTLHNASDCTSHRSVYAVVSPKDTTNHSASNILLGDKLSGAAGVLIVS